MAGIIWSDSAYAFHDEEVDILGKVAECSNIDINFDTCLMKGAIATIPLFLKQNLFDITLENGCRPPEVDDDMIQNIFLQAHAGCSFLGDFDLSDQEIQLSITATKELLSNEKCWINACQEIGGHVQEIIETAPVIAESFFVDTVHTILETVGKCSGVELEADSCIVKYTLDMIMNEAMVDVDNRRLNSIGSLLNDNKSICSPPDIDLDSIRHFVAVAEQMCDAEGIHTEIGSDIMLSINKMFSAEACWQPICNEFEGRVNAVIEAGSGITTSIIDKIDHCTGIFIDSDSCIANTVMDLIIQHIATGDGVNETLNLMDLLSSGVFLNSYENICIPPDIDITVINSLVQEAEYKCNEKGIPTEEGSLKNIASAMSKLFSSESCWGSVCEDLKRNINSAMEKTFQAKRLSLNYVLGCASIEFEAASCLESRVSEMILSYDDAVFSDEHISESNDPSEPSIDEFGNVLSSRKLESWRLDQCPIHYFETKHIEGIISYGASQCNDAGHTVTQNEIEKVEAKLSVLLSADQCWESVCHPDYILPVISNSVGKCLNIDLPLSMTNPEIVMNDPRKYLDDSRLACMINHVMTMDRSSFNDIVVSDDKSLQCLPPGFHDIKTICPSLLAPSAISRCTHPKLPLFTDDDWFGGVNFSYEYDFSFSYDFTGSYFSYDFSYNYGGEDNDNTLVKDLCGILETLSSEEGQRCLLPMCDLFNGGIGWFDSAFNGEKNYYSTETGTDFTSSPSLEPSVQTSTQPSVVSSLIPTFTSSMNPSSKPTEAPSTEPTILPTSEPTLPPSLEPSSTPKVGNVEIKFDASLTLDIKVDDIPPKGPELTKMVSVLAQSINHFLPIGAKAKILSIGGVSVARRNIRKLQEGGVKIDFEVIMKKQCSSASCDGSTNIANLMYEEVTENVQTAVTSGSLTQEIQEKASEQDITVLEVVSVGKDSFDAQEVTVKVEILNISNDDDNNDGDESAGIRSMQHTLLLGILALISFMSMIM